MALSKNTYSALHVISPYYINFERSASSSDIIIIMDVVNNNEPGEIYQEPSGDVIWLKIKSGFEFEVLSAEPTEKGAFHEEVEKLDQIRIRLKTNELFLIEYSDAAKLDSAHRSAVTGFQIGANDVLLLKIDNTNDTLTIYQMD